MGKSPAAQPPAAACTPAAAPWTSPAARPPPTRPPAVTLNNSTVSGNSASGSHSAGGVENVAFVVYNATLLLLDSTIANNTVSSSDGTGSQLWSGVLTGGTGSAAIQFRNSIVAGSGQRPNLLADRGGTFLSEGHNLSNDDGSGLLTGPGDLTNTDPVLGPLQDNGGPTLTHALLAGSPALNAGDPAQLGVADQRGVVRRGGVNIGAYQASATAFALAAAGPVTAGVPFDLLVTAVDPFGQVAVGYTGTVTFATDDPDGALPADYAFTAADAGSHAFQGGVTLYADGSLLTARDTRDDTLPGSLVITFGGR
jgi:hypothetical protein